MVLVSRKAVLMPLPPAPVVVLAAVLVAVLLEQMRQVASINH